MPGAEDSSKQLVAAIAVDAGSGGDQEGLRGIPETGQGGGEGAGGVDAAGAISRL